MMYSTALGMAQFARNTKALRLHVASDSAARNVWINSGASGIKLSISRYMLYTAKTAFLRTYECRCSRQERQRGTRGSRSSVSLEIFWRNRRVEPRMYSLGCCYNNASSNVTGKVRFSRYQVVTDGIACGI